jgi:ribosome-binding protein aMBF1 (putative translation factor)
MKLSDLQTSEQVLADELKDPDFRAEWARTTVARSLAVHVLTYRTANDLSQRAMARKLNMSQPQVARLEAGVHNPTIETLQRVADVLGSEFDLKVPPRHLQPTLTAKPQVTRRVRSAATVTEKDDVPVKIAATR